MQTITPYSLVVEISARLRYGGSPRGGDGGGGGDRCRCGGTATDELGSTTSGLDWNLNPLIGAGSNRGVELRELGLRIFLRELAASGGGMRDFVSMVGAPLGGRVARKCLRGDARTRGGLRSSDNGSSERVRCRGRGAVGKPFLVDER